MQIPNWHLMHHEYESFLPWVVAKPEPKTDLQRDCINATGALKREIPCAFEFQPGGPNTLQVGLGMLNPGTKNSMPDTCASRWGS